VFFGVRVWRKYTVAGIGKKAYNTSIIGDCKTLFFEADV
jgi:hypothetical protein